RAARVGRALLPPRSATQRPRRRQRLTAIASEGGRPTGAPFCFVTDSPTTAGTSAAAIQPRHALHRRIPTPRTTPAFVQALPRTPTTPREILHLDSPVVR